MSGGAFDYAQFRLQQIYECIKDEVDNNNVEPYPNADNSWDEAANKQFHENGDKRWEDRTINAFKTGLKYLRLAYIYAQRIDWLLSGDDGEESFHRRLADDLQNFDFRD